MTQAGSSVAGASLDSCWSDAPAPRPGEVRGPPAADEGGSLDEFEELIGRALAVHRRQVDGLREQLRLAQATAFEAVLPSSVVDDPPRLQGDAELGRAPPRRVRTNGSDCDQLRNSRTFSGAEEFRFMEEIAHLGSTRMLRAIGFATGGRAARKRRWAYELVHSWTFMAAAYALIIISSIFAGVDSEFRVQCTISGCDYENSWSFYVEAAVTALFTCEILLKLIAEDIYMFIGQEKAWNFFDVVAILASYVQLFSSQANESGVFRLVRILRIFRVLRVVRILQKLRVMIYTIIASLDTLGWVFAVLLLFGYIFAMIFMQAINDISHLESLEVYFGGLFQSLVTLFASFPGGLDWGDVYYALYDAHPIYGLVFLFYVYFSIMLVMNVVTATVVEHTTRVAHRDRDSEVADELERMKEYMKDVASFFMLADEDASGKLRWEEFETLLADDEMKAFFQTKLQLDISEAHLLFTVLDKHGDGEVGIQDFLKGCTRLKGHASSFDMHLAILKLDALSTTMGQHSKTLADFAAAYSGGTRHRSVLQ